MKEIYIFQKENKKENEVLRKVSKEVEISEINSKKIQDIIIDLENFLKFQPDGVGLAAPQIGKNERIFIIDPKVFKIDKREIPSSEDLIFINPKIIKSSSKKTFLDEGCFSVRWWYGQVNRSKNITIEALNKNGEKKVWGAGGLLSQVFQHEIDHLNGILFCDNAINLEKISDEKIKEIENEKKELAKKVLKSKK